MTGAGGCCHEELPWLGGRELALPAAVAATGERAAIRCDEHGVPAVAVALARAPGGATSFTARGSRHAPRPPHAAQEGEGVQVALPQGLGSQS